MSAFVDKEEIAKFIVEWVSENAYTEASSIYCGDHVVNCDDVIKAVCEERLGIANETLRGWSDAKADEIDARRAREKAERRAQQDREAQEKLNQAAEKYK